MTEKFEYSKQEKKFINERLKGIEGKGEIFDLINQGVAPEVLEERIQALLTLALRDAKDPVHLRPEPTSYQVFGKSLIAQNAIDDMNTIMRLPYVTGGALLPDAHRVKENYVPVGGVVVSDAIMPSVVGNDIACSVLLTITPFAVDDAWLDAHVPSMQYVLRNHSYFGQEMNPHRAIDKQDFFHDQPAVESDLGRKVWKSVSQMARSQFGTSGDGNHFVEFGTVDVVLHASGFERTKKGRFLAILSHFGSRSVGSTVAEVFEQAALERYKMPKGVLEAPLYLNDPIGRDYWKLMQWSGEFAEAGHRWLHQHLFDELGKRVALGFDPQHVKTVYSKHNFAWETADGIVHRKGATPAREGEYGIIPSTMGDESQIVVGLGNVDSFASASHGAGRVLSRGAALQQFKGSSTHDYVLREYGVTLLGGDSDEDPRAYKRIRDVMGAQESCVQSKGVFVPKVVRMAEPRMQLYRRKK